MEIQVIKGKSNNKNIFSEKLRVAAYVRVSTDLEKQTFSYESQIKYYNDLTSRYANWILVGLYTDYGLSGMGISKRKEFLRLIEDAYNGKIDMIITKSISRFARNTYDAINLIRSLKEKNIGIFFEEENINTLNMESELLISLLCSIAQEEAENLSRHITKSYLMKMEQGKIVTIYKIFGYDIVKKDDESNYIINKKEAKYVKEIFEMYLNDYSTKQIADYMTSKNIDNKYNNKKWSRDYVKDILKRREYTGQFVQGKRYTVNENGTKKRVLNHGEMDLFIIEDHHEAIIDKETFNRVQDIIKKRGTRFVLKENINDNNVPIICGFCFSYSPNMNFQTRDYYKCYISKKYKNKCNKSLPFKTELIKQCFLLCIEKIVNNRNILNDNINRLNASIRKNKLRKDLLLSLNSDNIDKYMNKVINLSVFNKKNNDIKNEVNIIDSELYILESKLSFYKEVYDDYKQLFYIMDNEVIDFNNFDNKIFNKIVSFVIIGGYSEKGTKLPNMIRFVFSNKKNLICDYKDKVLNNPLSNDNYFKLLDFKSNFKIRNFDHDTKKVKVKNGNRIIFEIER